MQGALPRFRPTREFADGMTWLIGALIVIAVVASYANSWSAPFVFDDVPAIVENPTIRDFRLAWTPPSDRGLPVTGRPIVNLSLAVNHALGGLNPAGYRITNTLLHALAALLLFGLVRRTLSRPGQSRCAAVLPGGAIAMIWALHPLQTAAVSYTIQRAEILVSMCYLLVLYGVARAAAHERSAPNSWRIRGWQAVSLFACAVGMATKEVMVSAPLVALLYHYAFVTTDLRTSVRRHGGFWLLLASTWLILAGLMSETGTRAGTAGFGLGVSSGAYALKQCETIVHYVRLALWPTPLVFDYGGMVLVSRPAAVMPQVVLVLTGVAITGVAIVRYPKLGFPAVFFFALLAPTSSVVPLADTMFEHRMYLALAAVITGIVATAWRATGRWSLPALVAAAAAMGGMAHVRNDVYRSELALWQDTVAKRPESVRARYTLGSALLAEGREDEAIEQYMAALRIDPDSPETHNNLGNAWTKLGRPENARSHYEAALRIRPSAETLNNYGNLLLRLGEGASARRQYEAALKLRPDAADAHNNLGNLLAEAGELEQAAEHYAAAVRADPLLVDAYANLGNTLAQRGRLDEAIGQYRAALRLNPKFVAAHFNLATAFAERREWREAIVHYRETLRLRPDYPGAREGLERMQVYEDVLGR